MGRRLPDIGQLDRLERRASGHDRLDPQRERIDGLSADFEGNAIAPCGDVLGPLTERDVLVEVGRGLTNAKIAERLVISPLTAKTHVSRILTKLAARDRAQLVVSRTRPASYVPATEESGRRSSVV